MMLKPHILLAFLWIIYVVLHSVLASLAVKSYFKKVMGNAFKHYRLAYTLFAFAGFSFIVLFQLRLPSPAIFTTPLLLKISGYVIGSGGLVLMLVCIKKYFAGLSGLKSIVQENVQPVLLVTGVHRYVRHPLYLGTFLFIWGLFLLYPVASLLVSNLVITLYTLVGIRLEESKLLVEFGKQYQTYRATVPMLWPRRR